MNGKESIKTLFWMVVAIILMGIDERISGFPFIAGACIIIYLFINTLILTTKEDEHKKQNHGSSQK